MRIIDCHCHVYPHKIAEKAVASIGMFYDVPMGQDGTAETLFKQGTEAGITDFLIHSVATTPQQVKAVNEFVKSEVDKHPGSFIGFGTLHPDSEDQEGDVEHLIELGLKGVKVHPDFIKCAVDDPRFMKIYEIVRGRIPICMHTGDYRYDYSNPNRLKVVLESFPDLLVIGAHFGGWSMWEKASEQLYTYDNLIVDCSSSLAWITPEVAVKCVRLYGSERVLFGTDFPMWIPGEEMERFNRLKLTDEERENIFHLNAERILGF